MFFSSLRGQAQQKASTTKMMSILGAFAACVFAIALPGVYCYISITGTQQTHRIEAASLAKSIEKIIQARTDLWEYESIRLKELISQPSIRGKIDEREIRSAAGKLIAKNDFTETWPFISVSTPLFDSGRLAGSITVRCSIRTQILITALLGVFSSLLGCLFYFLFRTYPLRKLENTLTDLQRAQEVEQQSREASDRLAEEMAVLAEIGRVIGSTLDIAEVYERFAAEARKLIPFDRLMVNLNNHDQKTITVAYAFGPNVPGRSLGDSFPRQGSVNEALERTRTVLLLHPTNVSELTGQYPHLAATFQAGINSFMSVPLISRDEVFAVLHFRSQKSDAYKAQDLRLAAKIGMQIAGAIANAQMFNDLNRTEKSLRESEERFRTLSDSTPLGMSLIANDGRYEYVNSAFVKIFGYDLSDIPTGKEWFRTAYPDPEYRRGVMADWKEDLSRYRNLEIRPRIYEVKCKDGAFRTIMFRPVTLPSGEQLIIYEDITERRQAEAALEAERSKLQQALDEVRTLRGIVPICSYCKKIRDDTGYWNQVEQYVSAHTDARFSHGICPTCFEREMKGIETSV